MNNKVPIRPRFSEEWEKLIKPHRWRDRNLMARPFTDDRISVKDEYYRHSDEEVDKFFGSPLKQNTLKYRRFLISVSFISLVIVSTGIFPRRLTALGIEFTTTDSITLLKILGLLIVYQCFSFIVYALIDYQNNVLKTHVIYQLHEWPRSTFIIAIVRSIFDLGFPILISALALVKIYSLVSKIGDVARDLAYII